jgi:arylsulfatase A-like enzyme
LLGLALLGAALTGCAGDRPVSAPVYDLGENLDFAQVTRETAAVDVGSDGDEAQLLGGWSHGEYEPRSGLSYRWGLEPHSELHFTVLEPRALTLMLEGRPRLGLEGSSAAVEVEINGQRAGRLDLGPDRDDLTLEVAAELLRRGDNRLRLRYDLGRSAVPPGEQRPIAVAWYRIAIVGLDRPAVEPAVDTERSLLFIPYGSQVEFHLRAARDGLLRSARRRFVSGPGMLTVHLGRDGEAERRLTAVTGDGGLEVALNAPAGEPVRLSLTAVATGPAGERGGVTLEAPAVWGVSQPPSDPPAPAPPASVVSGGARPNVIVYLVDTLRADRLGCYGHSRPVSPRIDRFAAGATLFENARANAPWTLPAVASVMTGLWPPAHGVFEDSRRLAPEAVTLAEALSGAGYQTAAVVTNGFATGAYGLDQGFDELTLIQSEGRKSSRVHEAAVDWLERRDPERPFFLYLHTIDPHKPYLPGEQYRRRHAPAADEIWEQIVTNPRKQRWEPTDSNVAQLLALYDAEVAENDASFGDTLDALKAAGLYDDALIVFLSDHGEEFHEHGSWTHASNLFRETLNVPLVVKLPQQREGRRVAELAQQIDLMPTLLAYLGIAGPETQGRPLPAILETGPTAGRRVFSHTRRPSQTTASLIDGDWKFIRRSDDRRVTSRLYNWREDPGERTDRAAERPVLAGLLAAELERHLASSVPPGVADATPDEAIKDNLRALGYID